MIIYQFMHKSSDLKYRNIDNSSWEDHVLQCLCCFSGWIQWSYWLFNQILKLTWNIDMTLIWLKMTLKSKTGFVLFSTVILGDMPRIYSDRGLQMTGALEGGEHFFWFVKNFFYSRLSKITIKGHIWLTLNLWILIHIWI